MKDHPRPPETNMPKILLAGSDLSLLATRSAVLSQLACVQWGSSEQAESALAKEHFEVLVLCHTLGLSERARLLSSMRQRSPETLVLQLQVNPYDDTGIERMRGIRTSVCEPRHLLQKLAGLLEESGHRHPQHLTGTPQPSLSHH